MKRCKILTIITAVAFLLAAVFFVFVELRLRSVRRELSKIEAENAAASAITKGVDKTLESYKLNYSDIVKFVYDSNENIKALSVDIITLNTFSNQIGKNIDSFVAEFEAHVNTIPISILIGEELTAGMGPGVKIYITMKGISSTKLTDIFEAAGVNQTRHKIMLEITMNMYVLYGSKVETVPYHSNVCVAESVIVGVTPSTFANLK